MYPWEDLDPLKVTIGDESIPDSYKICMLQGVGGEGEYDGENFGARISSIFVILITSTLATLFPVVAAKSKRVKVNPYVYLFARHFGTGVIVTTAFLHLMDPAYGAIGSDTCVGQTGNWAIYAWCPAIILVTVYAIFLVDFLSSVYVERKYGVPDGCHHVNVEGVITSNNESAEEQQAKYENTTERGIEKTDSIISTETNVEQGFHSQFAAFLVLEFGVIFHSVMIGLDLGSSGDEFKTLYIVLIFHQAFEGLGIGARLCAIPFPDNKKWWPYALCILYGITTPIAIAIGVGVRNTYAASSYNVNVISGVLDAISAGILMYTGLVELLARDYLFNNKRPKDLTRISFMVICNLLGAGIMALIGKWA